jgi:hypothetical protein
MDDSIVCTSFYGLVFIILLQHCYCLPPFLLVGMNSSDFTEKLMLPWSCAHAFCTVSFRVYVANSMTQHSFRIMSNTPMFKVDSQDTVAVVNKIVINS